MNYSPHSNNYKMPITANDPKPTFINQATNKPLMATNNVELNLDVLQQIQELTGVKSNMVDDISPPVFVPHKNPFRAKSGLLFRDILGRADNTQSCSSCGTKK